MSELEIEANQLYEFDAIQESGVELEPVYGPGLTGMKNLGNRYDLSYLTCTIICRFATFTNEFVAHIYDCN